MSFNTNTEEEGKTTMNNAQTFTREMAQDGNEAPVYFNEVHNANNWWVRHRRRQRIANAALALTLTLVAVFYCVVAGV